MSQALLLDTHVWLWWLLGDPRLEQKTVDYLDQLPAHNRPYLSDISLWELALLVDRKRLHLNQPLEDFLRIAASPATVQLCRIETATIIEMNKLPESFHRDPADRLIVATARARGLPLCSFDQLILQSRLTRIWTHKSSAKN